MEKTIMTMMMVIVMVVLLSQVVQGMVPQPTPGAFACPYCSQTFNTLQELVDHVASEHPDEPPIQPIDIGWD